MYRSGSKEHPTNQSEHDRRMVDFVAAATIVLMTVA
jgi:hypothetical protein